MPTVSGDQHKTSRMRGLPFNLSGGWDYDLEPLEAGAGQKEKRMPTVSGDQHKTSRMRGLPFNLSGGWDYDLEPLEAGAGQ
jgi:hypothetical protein